MKYSWKLNVDNSTFPSVSICRLSWLCRTCHCLSLSLSLVKGLRENRKKDLFSKAPPKSWEYLLLDTHIHNTWSLLMTACQASLSTVMITSLYKKHYWKLCFTVTLNYFFYTFSCFPTYITQFFGYLIIFSLAAVVLQEASFQWVATFWKCHFAFNI